MASVDHSKDLRSALELPERMPITPTPMFGFLYKMREFIPDVLGNIVYDYCDPLRDLFENAMNQTASGLPFATMLARVESPIAAISQADGSVMHMLVRLRNDRVIGFIRNSWYNCHNRGQVRQTDSGDALAIMCYPEDNKPFSSVSCMHYTRVITEVPYGKFKWYTCL